MAIPQENHQISKESKKTVIRQKEKAVLVTSFFAISLCLVGLCYWGAWHGGYVGLISMAGMCLWQGFARFIQKVVQDL
jgi:phosphatidylglycerophosphate synthase